MATLVRIDDLYLNLDTVTRIEVDDIYESVTVSFGGAAAMAEYGPLVMVDQIVLQGGCGARLLRWLDAGGRVSVAEPSPLDGISRIGDGLHTGHVDEPTEDEIDEDDGPMDRDDYEDYLAKEEKSFMGLDEE